MSKDNRQGYLYDFCGGRERGEMVPVPGLVGHRRRCILERFAGRVVPSWSPRNAGVFLAQRRRVGPFSFASIEYAWQRWRPCRVRQLFDGRVGYTQWCVLIDTSARPTFRFPESLRARSAVSTATVVDCAGEEDRAQFCWPEPQTGRSAVSATLHAVDVYCAL